MSPLQEQLSDMNAASADNLIQSNKNVEINSLHFPLSPRPIMRPKKSLPPWDKLITHDDISIRSVPSLPFLSSSEIEKNEQTICQRRRRRIFANVVQKSTSSNTTTLDPSPTQSPRKVIDFAMFTPSPQFLHDSKQRYKPVTQLPASYAYLPTIPSPLKRFYLEDGTATCLLGTYPMKKQPSILRQSSYPKLPETNDEGQMKKEESVVYVREKRATLLNLTNSVRCHPHPVCHDDVDNNNSNNNETSSLNPTKESLSSWEGSRVLFDPRITVIEFINDFQRQWFTDAELDRFKGETIILAETYLKQHPDLIEKYSTPIKDSVTRTLRRRALYSLPIMSPCNDCISSDQDHHHHFGAGNYDDINEMGTKD